MCSRDYAKTGNGGNRKWRNVSDEGQIWCMNESDMRADQ